MKRIAFIFLLIFSFLPVLAQHGPVIISSEDSLYIEKLLHLNIQTDDINEYISFYAKQLHNIPYAGGTLDILPEECLIVNVHKLDCTTFIETVLALSITKQCGKCAVSDYEKALQRARYHDGVINGYGSRLHYFSDWIWDNSRKGIVQEISPAHSSDKIPLELYFMSENADKYPLLKGNSSAIAQIREHEQNLSGDSAAYIPKEKLFHADLSWIKDGDIIAITTGRPGLDITHVGIACVINGAVHLTHASLKEHKVVTEPISLATYLSRNNLQTGIRVIRALNQRP